MWFNPKQKKTKKQKPTEKPKLSPLFCSTLHYFPGVLCFWQSLGGMRKRQTFLLGAVLAVTHFTREYSGIQRKLFSPSHPVSVAVSLFVSVPLSVFVSFSVCQSLSGRKFLRFHRSLNSHLLTQVPFGITQYKETQGFLSGICCSPRLLGHDTHRFISN